MLNVALLAAAPAAPSDAHIVMLLLIQIGIIILLSRGMGLLFKKISQPLVIGEIVAGILLGPSFFGLIAPDLSAQLFPAETLPYLNILAQVGLVFFMFLVGLEFNADHLKGKGHAAVVVSHVSIIAPFFLGAMLALYLYERLSTSAVPFTSFALFMGAAMSVTAFPVLARILTERNLHKTYLGAIAITCAAVDDVTAWCLLAFVISVVRSGDVLGAVPTTLLAAVYIVFMLTVGRMLLERLADYVERSTDGRLTQLWVAVIFLGVLTSATITEVIGIHNIFGAFLFGAVMPQRRVFVRDLAEKTEDFTVVFLLPIFFAYTGLRTQFGLLNNQELWFDCVLVILAATIGKFGGSAISAKFAGLSWRESSALGVLMNTRGLMELIILNIGLDLGVISPALFAMMVIMALVTTFATTPILEWIYPQERFGASGEDEESMADAVEPDLTYSVVVAVANPGSQPGLLRLARALVLPEAPSARLYPVNLVRLGDEYSYDSLPDQAEQLVAESRARLSAVLEDIVPQARMAHPISQISDDVPGDLCRIARVNHADLILLGWHRPTFTQDLLGGNVRPILEAATADVAVFIDRNLELGPQAHLAVPYSGTIHDRLAVEIALRLAIGHGARMTILQAVPLSRETRDLVALFQERLAITITPLLTDPLDDIVEASRQADLLVVGTSAQWGLDRHIFGQSTDELATRCQTSLLIVKHHKSATPHIEALLNRSANLPTLTTAQE